MLNNHDYSIVSYMCAHVLPRPRTLAPLDIFLLLLLPPQLECSFQRGNCFMSLSFRVYLPPDKASGQLLTSKHADSDSDLATDGGEDAFLIEAQLHEGDRLNFSALFRDVLRAFKVRALPPPPSKLRSSRLTAARPRCVCILGRGQESRGVTKSSQLVRGRRSVDCSARAVCPPPP